MYCSVYSTVQDDVQDKKNERFAHARPLITEQSQVGGGGGGGGTPVLWLGKAAPTKWLPRPVRPTVLTTSAFLSRIPKRERMRILEQPRLRAR
jgi:hypothetical protein